MNIDLFVLDYGPLLIGGAVALAFLGLVWDYYRRI